MIALYAALASAAVSLALGGWLGMRWEEGNQAIALKAANDARKVAEQNAADVALTHANNTAAIAAQLGDARVRIRSLTTGRNCLSADAVRVLNGAAGPGVPAAAAQPASAPEASATDQDVGDALAICRSGYGQLSEQLNAILDINAANSRH